MLPIAWLTIATRTKALETRLLSGFLSRRCELRSTSALMSIPTFTSSRGEKEFQVSILTRSALTASP